MKLLKTAIFAALTLNNITDASTNSWSLLRYLPLYFQVNNLYQEYQSITENKEELSLNEVQNKLLNIKKNAETLLSENSLYKVGTISLLSLIPLILSAKELLKGRPKSAIESSGKISYPINNEGQIYCPASVHWEIKDGSYACGYNGPIHSLKDEKLLDDIYKWQFLNFSKIDALCREEIKNYNYYVMNSIVFKSSSAIASATLMYIFYKIEQLRKLNLLIAKINNHLAQ